MEAYLDINHDSGVAAFEAGTDYIRIQFKDGQVYLYTNTSAGAHNIATMKSLAKAGNGLNAYINRHVKNLYALKE